MKSLVAQTPDVFAEIQIVVSESPSCIITFLASQLRHRLCIVNDRIVRSVPRLGFTMFVMDGFSAVYTQNDVVHFAIQIFARLFVQQYAVRRHRESNGLSVFCGKLLPVFDCGFYRIEVK